MVGKSPNDMTYNDVEKLAAEKRKHNNEMGENNTQTKS